MVHAGGQVVCLVDLRGRMQCTTYLGSVAVARHVPGQGGQGRRRHRWAAWASAVIALYHKPPPAGVHVVHVVHAGCCCWSRWPRWPVARATLPGAVVAPGQVPKVAHAGAATGQGDSYNAVNLPHYNSSPHLCGEGDSGRIGRRLWCPIRIGPLRRGGRRATLLVPDYCSSTTID